MQNIIFTTPENLRELITAAVRDELAGIKTTEQSVPPVEFLTRKETADRLKVSLVSLNQWTKTGLIQGYRISGRVRYKSNEVESALQAMQTIKNRG